MSRAPARRPRTRLVVLALAGAAMAGGALPARAAGEGESLFKRQCFACHTVEPGKNKIGPSLAGIVGRKSGTVPGFTYSDANKKANVEWTDAKLDEYLTDPKAFMPGTKMIFAGLKKPEERQAVIAYLKDQH